MKRNSFLLGAVILGLLLGSARHAKAQAVAVTVRLDTNSIPAGGSTTLRVFAQVVPGLRSTTDRIFSWYLDVLNTNGAAASGNYAAMLKPSSDNDSQISSFGVTQGANRRGVYDTFMNLPGAGVNAPVELMRIPVSGLAVGQTRFVVQAGTGADLSTDFLVAPIGGGAPNEGGSYAVAFADLQVTAGDICAPVLQIARLAGGTQARITFTPCAGRTHTLESLSAIDGVAVWQTVAGAPHNSGNVVVNITGAQRFYRLRITNP